MTLITFLAFSLLLLLLLQGALGELVCEQLPVELCSYAISSSGKRCSLENYATKDGENLYECKTSEVIVDAMQGWIESDECLNACGLDRKTVGISSDSLLQPQILAKICSDDCYQSCPNIVDLYYNLAFGEGAYLPDMCANPRRALPATKSSGDTSGPNLFTGEAAGPSQFIGKVSPAAAPIYAEMKPDCAPSAT